LIQEYTGSGSRAGKDKTYAAHDRPYREMLAESAQELEERAHALPAEHADAGGLIARRL
jgi:hypothetical protein